VKKHLLLFVFAVAGFGLSWAQNAEIDQIKKLFAERHIKEKLEECINLCEALLAKEVNYDVAVYLSRAYYFKGETEPDKNIKLDIFLKGVDAGEKALSKVKAYTDAMATSKKEEEAIKKITKEDIEGLYWVAANLARYAKFAPFGKKLAVKGRVRYLWDHVLAIAPEFNYGGVYRFFGGYYALVPSITGEQDPAKSKEMFDKGVAVAPHYLETKVLYAEAYCTHAKIKNKELFNQLLDEVLATDISQWPEIYPENLNAQNKAKELKAKQAEFFD
jgi:hypothetical protein